jgi:regulator of sigma E protease
MIFDLSWLSESAPAMMVFGDLATRLQALGANVWSLFQVLVGLGFVIFVHELGHFLAAKFFGVKCEKFYVGFDVPIKIGPIRLPAKLAKFTWGETEYGIGIIPLGGYVKMLGQDDDPRRAEEERQRIQLSTDPNSVSSQPKLDPRSFPAKSVFARMVIISAGVILNVLFAVILAGSAFVMGVPYSPALIGTVTPGDPAWAAGVQPGDKVVQFAGMEKPNPKMYFDDIREAMALATFDNPEEPIPILVERGSEKKEFRVKGTFQHSSKGDKRVVVGVVQANSTTIASIPFQTPDAPVKDSGIKAGDVIISVNGTKLPVNPVANVPLEWDFVSIADKTIDQDVAVQVERLENKETKIVDLKIPPIKMKTMGFELAVGPIEAIQVGSVAEQAGIAVGDQIVEFDGQPVRDGLTLHLAIARKAGQDVSLKINRAAGDGTSKTMELKFRVPEVTPMNNFSTIPGQVGYEVVGSGLVYSVGTKVTGVDADANTGLEIGDELSQYEIVMTGEEKARVEDIFSSEAFKPTVLNKQKNPILLHHLSQSLPSGTKIKLHVTRNGKVNESQVVLRDSANWHWSGRGLVFKPARLIHKAESISEATTLGLRETKRRLGDVFTFLRLAFSGKLNSKAVGGPLVIFTVATDQASQGISKLLMFLTLLSANLAILNFLPIPALDGGHMMFLIMEAIRGKPVDEKLQASATMVGVLALLAFMAFVMINDVLRLGFFG